MCLAGTIDCPSNEYKRRIPAIKKMFCFLLIFMMALAMAACGIPSPNASELPKDPSQTPEKSTAPSSALL